MTHNVLIVAIFAVLLYVFAEKLYKELKYKNEQPLHKNFPFTWRGIQYWYSRSCAAVLFVFCKDKDGNLRVLANKRGKGTPDFQGCWNAPCGYIDFDEDGKEGAIREVKEETGLAIPYESVKLIEVTSSPKQNRQNITLRHIAILDGVIDDYTFNTKDMEENEVDDVAWIKINDVLNYKWAFGHDLIINQMNYRIENNLIADCSAD